MDNKTLKNTALFFFAWLAISLLANGCVCVVHGHGSHDARTVYVSKPPPAPKKEEKTSAPSSKHVWVDGYWDYNEADDDWEWEEGSWEVPPEEGSTWEKPAYKERENGKSVYTPGKWVREKDKKPSYHGNKDSKKDKGDVVPSPHVKADLKKDEGPVEPSSAVEKEKPEKEANLNETKKVESEKEANINDGKKEKEKPGGASSRQADEDKKPGGASSRQADEDEKPGGASSRQADEDEKPGGASAKGAKKDKPSTVQSTPTKCKKSRSCDCNNVCEGLEKPKTCGDCK